VTRKTIVLSVTVGATLALGIAARIIDPAKHRRARRRQAMAADCRRPIALP